jgi:hypothetical protein
MTVIKLALKLSSNKQAIIYHLYQYYSVVINLPLFNSGIGLVPLV